MGTISGSLLNRRTIRRYSERDVEEKMLDYLLLQGSRTSTTGR
jgi:hypothetical protein